MIKKTFRVEGMHCSNCPMEVDGIEDDLPGIKQVSASYRTGARKPRFLGGCASVG